MPKRVAILHAYSANNLGDGLLVRETMRLAELALDSPEDPATVTIAALRPETFGGVGARVVTSRPKSLTQAREYLAFLRDLPNYDVVLGVGGGYLRFGNRTEALKTALGHLPQLIAASRVGARAVYLPQSIGPAGPWAHRFTLNRLNRLNRVYLRDDRSVHEFAAVGSRRVRDLALIRPQAHFAARAPDPTSILSVRPVHGHVPTAVQRLADDLGVFDGYIQSATGSNDDGAAMRSLQPRHIVSAAELLGGARCRVVIAVRLHAALMALAAGHYAIHLAYERKGFGAFADLGLPQYVHPVSRLDPTAVSDQFRELVAEVQVRDAYAQQVNSSWPASALDEQELVTAIRDIACGSVAQS